MKRPLFVRTVWHQVLSNFEIISVFSIFHLNLCCGCKRCDSALRLICKLQPEKSCLDGVIGYLDTI